MEPEVNDMDDEVIRNYISQELVRNRESPSIENSTPLLDTGILDSLSLLRLVVFIEEQFGIRVNDLDVVPENFATVDAICTFLRSRGDREAAASGGERRA